MIDWIAQEWVTILTCINSILLIAIIISEVR